MELLIINIKYQDALIREAMLIAVQQNPHAKPTELVQICLASLPSNVDKSTLPSETTLVKLSLSLCFFNIIFHISI